LNEVKIGLALTRASGHTFSPQDQVGIWLTQICIRSDQLKWWFVSSLFRDNIFQPFVVGV